MLSLGNPHKIPELVEKENMGDGVQGEPDLSDNIVQGDLEAEGWKELFMDFAMADFILWTLLWMPAQPKEILWLQ
jgi:hypothetical protein